MAGRGGSQCRGTGPPRSQSNGPVLHCYFDIRRQCAGGHASGVRLGRLGGAAAARAAAHGRRLLRAAGVLAQRHVPITPYHIPVTSLSRMSSESDLAVVAARLRVLGRWHYDGRLLMLRDSPKMIGVLRFLISALFLAGKAPAIRCYAGRRALGRRHGRLARWSAEVLPVEDLRVSFLFFSSFSAGAIPPFKKKTLKNPCGGSQRHIRSPNGISAAIIFFLAVFGGVYKYKA